MENTQIITQLFTLHKDNVAQIDPDTDIKVVRKMDVFPEGQIVINPEINSHEQQNHIPLQTTSFDEPVLTPNAPPLVFKPSITVVGSNTGHLDIKAPEENTPTPMAANEPNMNIVFKEPTQMGGSVPTVVSEEKPTIENPTNITNDIVVKKLS